MEGVVAELPDTNCFEVPTVGEGCLREMLLAKPAGQCLRLGSLQKDRIFYGKATGMAISHLRRRQDGRDGYMAPHGVGRI